MDRPESIVVAFDRSISRAKTVNSTNAILIQLENRMGPDDEAALFQHIMRYPITAPRLFHYVTALRLKLGWEWPARRPKRPERPFAKSRHLRQWGHSLWQHSRMSGLHRSPRLLTGWHLKEASFFRYRGGSSRLIIALGGGVARFGMRTPTLTRFLEVAEADVLLLRPPHQKSYSDGVAGLGFSFAQLINRCREMSSHYGDVMVTGISKGAVGALVLGGAIDASRIVVLGLTKNPCDELVETLARNSSEKTELLDAWTKALDSSRCIITYGSEAPRDKVASGELHRLMRHSELVEVANSPHAVLWPLAQRGELRAALAEWFGEGRGTSTGRGEKT
jgi:hypothetical protein